MYLGVAFVVPIAAMGNIFPNIWTIVDVTVTDWGVAIG